MTRLLTPAEVQLHSTKEDLYMIINNNVYDATSFVEEHPGGYDVLLEVAGQDATEPYIATDHSEEADDILSDLKIGTLDLSVKPTDLKDAVKVDTIEVEPEVIEGIEPPPAFPTRLPAEGDVTIDKTSVLKPEAFQDFRLAKKTEISHNVAIYRFSLPTPTSTFGLPVGQHISIGALLPPLSGGPPKEVVRSYTPISDDHQPGFFDLLIKTYPGGAITQHVSSLSIGDAIRVRGPKGAFMYTANMVRRIGMIAGGTGITPMLQIINAVRRGRETGDKTQIDFIFANVDEGDILLRDELDVVVREDDGIRVNYVLNNAPEGWKGGVGFVTREMVEKWLPPPASDVKILLCGPPPMIGAMKKVTEALGYEKARLVSRLEDQVFAF